jgi:predicted 2-oxoglutarate/Fe(II)-dependent dioxygenase YbiX
MNEPYLSKITLAPGIVLYKTDPEKINYLSNEIENSIKDQWITSRVVNTADQTEMNYSTRSCLEYPISKNDQDKKDLYEKINSWINPLFLDYKNNYSVESLTAGPYILLKYSDQDKFDAHMDDCAKFPRTVSMSAYLNNNYLGGELEFPHFGVFYKPEIGDVILFSSSFPYLHQVHKIIDGIRYAIVNWYRFEGYPVSMDNVIVEDSQKYANE